MFDLKLAVVGTACGLALCALAAGLDARPAAAAAPTYRVILPSVEIGRRVSLGDAPDMPATNTAPTPPPATDTAPTPPPPTNTAPTPPPATNIAPTPPPATDTAPTPPPAAPAPPAPTPTPLSASAPTCAVPLQALVDRAAPGSVVDVPPCLYREQVTIAKPLTLAARPGAEIRGSDVWTGWQRQGSYWTRGTLPRLDQDRKPCRADAGDRCNWPEQLFLDGQPLQQVAASPGPGQFAVDAARRGLLAADPTGRLVEVTTRRHWIVGEADGVVVRGFRMRHAATPAQHGAIANFGHSDWTIEQNVLSDAHGAPVSLHTGRNLRLVGNDVFRGGQLGVHGGESTDVLVQGNRIHDNNTEGFDPEWEAGGLKMAVALRLTIERNQVFRNDGPGLWCDIDCRDVVFAENQVHENTYSGIMFEISDGARISGNTVWENGWAKPQWGWGAGILVSSSANAEVVGNVLAWNADAISIISQRRDDAPSTNGTGHSVRENRVVSLGGGPTALGWFQDWAGAMYRADANNRGSDNAYWLSTPEGGDGRFEWDARALGQLAEFGATPGGANSRYLSVDEKEQLLRGAGIPSAAVTR
jgi:parallel beta-helix repeat protein